MIDAASTARVVVLASVAAMMLGGTNPARAFRFEKVSDDTQTLIPEPQQSEPGGPMMSFDGDAQTEFASFVATFDHVIDCGITCETACVNQNLQCLNLSIAVFTIDPDPSDRIGDPIRVCVSHSYDLSATATGDLTGSATVGGVLTGEPTLVIRTPGGVEFSNGPVRVMSGTQSDRFFQAFTAQIGDTIEMRMGTEVASPGNGVGSFRGLVEAELRVFSCPPEAAPALSKPALVGMILLLVGGGVLGVRRRARPRNLAVNPRCCRCCPCSRIPSTRGRR